MPPWEEWGFNDTNHVQIWSLHDLRLLATIPLPEVDDAAYHIEPAEPRILQDGTVYVNTFSCGSGPELGSAGGYRRRLIVQKGLVP